MSIEGQVITLLGTLLGLLIAAITIWKFIQSHIAAVVKPVADQSSAAGALATMTQNLLSEHKLHVAETYVTKAGLREFRDEVMGGIKEIKGSVSKLDGRMDQIIMGERGKLPE
jgi:hypothetical protein